MLLDKETIGAINFHCGDGGNNFGEHSDGLLWVGAVTDDEGKEVYGLHLATAEYPEEGSTTLVEFDEPISDFDAQRLRADTAEAELTKMTADRDSLKGIASAYIASDGEKDLRIAAAEQRNAELRGCGPKRMREAARSAAPNIPGDVIDHILSCAIAALNPNPEAESHE